VPSPYPAQMIGYPSPGYAPQPPNMMSVTPTAQNGGRGRGMPMMSPVMSHAHAHPGPALYGGSPVMLHAVQVPQNHSYMPMPAGRGQPRTDNGQMPAQQQHVVHHPASHGGFNTGPTSSFVRPQWLSLFIVLVNLCTVYPSLFFCYCFRMVCAVFAYVISHTFFGHRKKFMK